MVVICVLGFLQDPISLRDQALLRLLYLLNPILAARRSSSCDVTSAYVKGSLRLKKADKIIYHLRCYPELISRQTDGKCLRQMQLSGWSGSCPINSSGLHGVQPVVPRGDPEWTDGSALTNSICHSDSRILPNVILTFKKGFLLVWPSLSVSSQVELEPSP